jgi:hypothetical protein
MIERPRSYTNRAVGVRKAAEPARRLPAVRSSVPQLPATADAAWSGDARNGRMAATITSSSPSSSAICGMMTQARQSDDSFIWNVFFNISEIFGLAVNASKIT